jgi:NYN domain
MGVHDPSLHRRVAVIIDAENVPFVEATQFLEDFKASRYSHAIAVADWSNACVAAYQAAPAALGLRLVHCFPKLNGKSRSDFAICGEAIRMIDTNTTDEVVIVSRDRDFDIFIASSGAQRAISRREPPLGHSITAPTTATALTALLSNLPEDGRGVSLNVLGKSLKASSYGYSRLSKLIEKYPEHCEIRDGMAYRTKVA